MSQRQHTASEESDSICRHWGHLQKMIHGFGSNAQFTSKNMKGEGCLIFLRHNKPSCPSLPSFLWSFCYNLIISITLQVYPGMCQWSLLKELNANTGVWLNGFQCHSSPAASERRTNPLGIWMAAVPILFKIKWPQVPGSGSDYGFGRVHILRKDRSPPHPWAYRILFQRFAMAVISLHTFPQLLYPLLSESSPDRNWPPRWFRQIIPKIIALNFL